MKDAKSRYKEMVASVPADIKAEIVLGMAMVVFFTLFFSNLWVVGRYRFWIVSGVICVFLILLVTIYIPRTIRDFKNLTSTE